MPVNIENFGLNVAIDIVNFVGEISNNALGKSNPNDKVYGFDDLLKEGKNVE